MWDCFRCLWKPLPGMSMPLACLLSCFSHVWLFVAPWTVAHQAPLSMVFFRREYWSGLPFPTPGDLPDPGIEFPPLKSPALAGKFFTTSAAWGAHISLQEISLWSGIEPGEGGGSCSGMGIGRGQSGSSPWHSWAVILAMWFTSSKLQFSSVQFSSIAQSCPTLWHCGL